MRTALVIAMLLALSPAAHAATVRGYGFQRPYDERDDVLPHAVISFQAHHGERNDVRIGVLGAHRFRISDARTKLTPSGTCRRRTAHQVDCVLRGDADTQTIRVHLGDGNDRLSAPRSLGGATLVADGGVGNDALTGTDAADTLAGGGGRDRLDGRGGDDALLGQAGDDRLLGGAGNDVLTGGVGVDALLGGDGADVLDGSDSERKQSADTLDGGPGLDTVGYDGYPRGVTISLLTHTGGLKGEHDRLRGIENLGGTTGADHLTGDDGPNRIFGDGGADVIDARGGDDRLEVYSDHDQSDLHCGAGSDDVAGPSAQTLVRADCETVDQLPVQPTQVTPTSITLPFACTVSDVALTSPDPSPAWDQQPGEFTSYAFGSSVGPGDPGSTQCPVTLTLNPAGQAGLAAGPLLATVNRRYSLEIPQPR